MEVFLPTYDSTDTVDRLFADDYHASNVVKYCTTSTGTINLSPVSLGTHMTISSLSF